MDVWTPNRFRLFLSHVSAHKDFAQALKTAFDKHAITGFVAHSDIEPTAEWQDVIEESLRSAEALLALLTPDFSASKWTDQEVGFAVGRGILVVPVKAGLDPYGFVGKYQAFQGASKTAPQIAEAVAEILAKHKSTALRMAYALVSQFEESWSWASAKANMEELERVAAFDGDLVSRLETAVKNNSQIRDAFGVPDRVTALIKRFTS